MIVSHDFKKKLTESHLQSKDEMWKKVYKEAFPTFMKMVSIEKDGWAQRGGIDRIIILSSGREIKIDEKIRPDKDYGDILLEYKHIHINGRETNGWLAKDLACDYIAYAVIPSQKCYLLPFHLLRKAWQVNRYIWVGKYKKIEAKNKTYTTISVAVPVETIFESITNAIITKW